ncbi:MAG TPA: thiolase family protein, partial [Herpetosiphonaceae bacterium]
MNTPVIVEALRAPIGRHNGSLAGTRPDALYALVLDALLERSGLDPAAVEDVITGCVSQVGEQGANIGRLAVLLSQLPKSVPAFSLNRMCGSSQQAIHLGAQAIAAGDARYVVCGGVESMTRVPMFSDLHGSLAALNPALFERHELVHQGESAERVAAKYSLAREELDAWSVASHLRAAHARAEGRFEAQIVAVPAEGGVFGQDEAI